MGETCLFFLELSLAFCLDGTAVLAVFLVSSSNHLLLGSVTRAFKDYLLLRLSLMLITGR
uniref:Uncharacterized protein n=1 Tax=Rhizophora mucronata TaxID=61149 RepID=A0A2P2NP67_RHIMU